MPRVLEADLTWTGGAFEPGVRIAIGDDGRIEAVGADAGETTERLERRALIPGMVNAHSHAFQRGLRGTGESFPAGGGSFWSWRETMYRLAAELEPESLRRLAVQAFGEMLDCGITAVGEFHYLHHDRPEDFRFDELILDAATEAGIRIALLSAYYRTGGIGAELAGGQRRFRTASPAAYWAQVDALAGSLAKPGRSIGAVVHSVRAADPGEIGEIAAEARRRGLVLHLHLEEQRREVEAARAAYGSTPMGILLDRAEIGPWVTAVHCTHTDPAELRAFLDAGGRVCVCPLTEANLGDGLPPLADADCRSASLALGSDSNLRISMLEEMRWLEYGQRLRGERRGVFADPAGAVGRNLLEVATLGGARSLGIEAGRIEAGLWADLAALDLDHPTLRGWRPETLIDAFVFGGGDGAIAGTAVAGRWRALD